jgi:hypothetical protein
MCSNSSRRRSRRTWHVLVQVTITSSISQTPQ